MIRDVARFIRREPIAALACAAALAWCAYHATRIAVGG
jgi:hypothetical protein